MINGQIFDSKQKILSSLKGVNKTGENQWMAKCPAHNDKKPSLSIAIVDGSKILLRCHAGCSVEDICKKIGISPRDLFIDKPKQNPHRKIAASYNYMDERDNLLFQTVREKQKRFWQQRPDGNGGWINNLKGVRRVLYRLPELLKADPAKWIFICEGEKDVDRLLKFDLVATTNPMGAGKWKNSYSDFLIDRKVAILPDNDKPGQEHAEDVAHSLHGKAETIKIINLPGLPEKADVSDWLDNGGTIDELQQFVDKKKEYHPLASSISSNHNLDKPDEAQTKTKSDNDGETHATKLISLTSEAELFHNCNFDAFVTFKIDNHWENWPVKSKRFRLWLTVSRN